MSISISTRLLPLSFARLLGQVMASKLCVFLSNEATVPQCQVHVKIDGSMTGRARASSRSWFIRKFCVKLSTDMSGGTKSR